jgi:hypothetical protein
LSLRWFQAPKTTNHALALLPATPRRLRRDPGWWEILQHWVIFSIVFEVILPRMPNVFRHTSDPWNVVAYLAVGILAGICWKI